MVARLAQPGTHARERSVEKCNSELLLGRSYAWRCERPVLHDDVFDAGVLNCRSERVPATVGYFLVSKSNLVRYSHWQGIFTSLKRGFKYMDRYGDFKVNLIHFIIYITSL